MSAMRASGTLLTIAFLMFFPALYAGLIAFFSSDRAKRRAVLRALKDQPSERGPP